MICTTFPNTILAFGMHHCFLAFNNKIIIIIITCGYKKKPLDFSFFLQGLHDNLFKSNTY
jgi:hypothetical protein